MKRLVLSLCVVIAISATASTAAAEAHLMRWADVHGDTIVFTYEDDLWLVPSSGGDARRITNHPGSERFAKFSPDGSLIAFTAGYDGGTDVYVMDARGGIPKRLTFHPAQDLVLGWEPAGQRVLFRSRREYPTRAEMLYTVSVDGGMPVKLPVDRAGLASFSPDGTRIAYNRITREDRTWKRHQGGTAQDIWVGTLGRGDFDRITDWKGTDNHPMWQGGAIYFTSDRQHGTLNLFRHDLASGGTEALTRYTDYDVKYPSAGPGAIVFQYGESLHLLDLSSGRAERIEVRLGSDRVPVRTGYVNAGSTIGTFSLSPNGDHVLVEARGEILVLPVEEGDPENLTQRSASREKNAAWAPDGHTVAFVSDRSGDEEVWLLDPDDPGEWKRLTRDGKEFHLQPVWSPDGRFLLFADKSMRLNLVDATSGEVQVIDRGEYDDAWEAWGIQDYVFSADSRWIAYSKMERSLYQSIFLYSLDTGAVTRVTGQETSDWSPAFDPEGRYLYFLSRRSFNPIMGHVDQNHVFLNMARPYVVILGSDRPSPFAPGNLPTEEDGDPGDDEESNGEPTPVEIDLDGLSRRVVAAEGVGPGDLYRLEATAEGFFYLSRREPGFLKYNTVGDATDGGYDLYSYNLQDKSAQNTQEDVGNYHLSGDRSQLVYRSGDRFRVLDFAASDATDDEGAVSLDGVTIKVDRQEEFLQIFNEAWRVQRDWFYDPGMHGVDWARIGDKYRQFVPDCGNRADLNYLIGEMIAELNVGHTYIFGGDMGSRPPRVRVGLLGADFSQPEGSGYHSIAHIVEGTSWLPGERSPLQELGCGVAAGDYLISIDGREVSSADNVFAFLEDTVGRAVTVAYNQEPSADGVSTCRVTPIASESAVRYREWVEGNRARVEAASNGAIGYLHIPNMGEQGLIEFARAFYPQYYKKAIIVDERYNGGGFVGDMIIDRLERSPWSLVHPREGHTIPQPERCFHGHLAVLINEDTGSNGEYFAEAIKIYGLATVIGMRTWGGAVGIEPHQDLVDGAVTTPPQFAPFGLDRRWLIEGHGVDPDIEVQNMPGDVLAGADPQLEAAVEHLLEKLQQEPLLLPDSPPFPDKSKPGEGAGDGR